MPVSEQQRRKVKSFIIEQEKITRPARAVAKKTTARVVNGILRSQGDKQKIDQIIRKAWLFFSPVLADIMLLGHLQGHHRSIKDIPKDKRKKPFVLASSLFQASVRTARRLSLLSKDELGELTDKYALAAKDLTQELARTSTEQVLNEMARVQQAGFHPGSIRRQMAQALDSAGFKVDNPSVVETIVRTQTKVAFEAGRWHANQSPAIDEILWGYLYINPDDERSRATHAAMDGMTLPKGHPRWQVDFPPNGFNCRCSVISLFDEHETVNPEGTVQDGSKQKIIQADEGWQTNFGREFLPATPVTLPKLPKPAASVLPKPKKKTVKKAAPKKKKKTIKKTAKKFVSKKKVSSKPKPLPETGDLDPKVEAWIQNLPEDQLDAIEFWTGDSTDVRNIQQGRAAVNKQFAAASKEALQLINEAAKTAPKFKGTVFRGAKKLRNPEQFLKVGNQIEYASWNSASTNVKVAHEFGSKFFFRVKTKTGMDLGSLSVGGEEEIMLRAGKRFRVVSVKQDGLIFDSVTKKNLRVKNLIDLEEI